MKKTIKSAFLLIAVFLFLTGSALAVQTVKAESVTVSGTVDNDMAFEVLDLVNAERKTAGLEALTMDADLVEAARQRAMETTILFAHMRPDGSEIWTVSPKMNGENLASGQLTASEVMASWMASPTHKENILKSTFKSIGIVCFKTDNASDPYKYYWVQCFGNQSASAMQKTTGTETVSAQISLTPGETDTAADLAAASVADISNKAYTGTAIKPSVKVTLGGNTLKKGTDYTLSYKNNKNIGTAVVIVTGMGSYTGAIEKSFTINVVKGASYTVKSIKYKITSALTTGKGTVTVTGTTTKKNTQTSLTIGGQVNIGGVAFQITAVGNGAFKGYTALKSVTFGSRVKKIGNNAFSGCSALAKLTFNTKNLNTVGGDAIKSIRKNAVIYVPSVSVAAYKSLFTGKTGFKKTMRFKTAYSLTQNSQALRSGMNVQG